MDTNKLLKDAALCFAEETGAALPVNRRKLTGFNRLWDLYTEAVPQKPAPRKKFYKKIIPVAAITAGVLILVLAIGTAASQDWDDSIFGALRRLLNADLNQNEFSVTEEEVRAWHVDKVGFTLAGDDYSTVPTLKEFLIHGWKIDHATRASGYYDTNKGPVMQIDSYCITRGKELLTIELCGADINNNISTRDCRIGSINVHIDTYINQSNISDFVVNDINLISCDTSQLDDHIGLHISSNDEWHYAGGTIPEDEARKLETYIYKCNGILSGTGITSIEADLKPNSDIIFDLRFYFDAYSLQDYNLPESAY